MGMGFLGAVSGGASGLSDAILQEMDEAKQVRLENLRTSNNRETNSINNTQRHELSMEELAQRDKMGIAAEERANVSKRASDTYASKLRDGELTTMQKNAAGYEESGAGTAAEYYKNEQTTASGKKLPADAQMIDYLEEKGMPPEAAIKLVTSAKDKTPEAFRRDIIEKIAGNEILADEPEEAKKAMVDSLMKLAYPDLPAPDGGGVVPPTKDEAIQWLEKNNREATPENIQKFIDYNSK